MPQDWTDDCYAPGHVGQTDLGNMKKNFLCLKSLYSGASQPASMAACHPWFDTTKHVLKVRDDGGSAWLGLMHGDTSQKIWVYRNSTMDGWLVDSGVSDKVLALKGGSTYTAGGATAGTWTQPSHTLTLSEIPAHDHNVKVNTNAAGSGNPATDYIGDNEAIWRSTTNATNPNWIANAGGGGSHNHGSAYRPAAAVGTLQYLDL